MTLPSSPSSGAFTTWLQQLGYSTIDLQTLSSHASSSLKTFTIRPAAQGKSTQATRTLLSFAPLGSGDARIDSQALPGINKEFPILDNALKVTAAPNLDVSENSLLSPEAPVATPMPGKNQPKPAMDATAAASFMLANGFVPESTSEVLQSVLEASILSASQTPFTTFRGNPLKPLTSSSPVPATSIGTQVALLSKDSTGSQTVFVTRVEQGKEQAAVSLESSRTPLAIPIAQPSSAVALPSSLVTSTSTLPTAALFSLAAANAPHQDGDRLTPLARTLFIIFGVLGTVSPQCPMVTYLTCIGALSILIAFGVVILMQVSRKKALSSGPSQHRNFGTSLFDDAPNWKDYRVATYISADDSVTSMTRSEKAIVMRVASPDGESHVSYPPPPPPPPPPQAIPVSRYVKCTRAEPPYIARTHKSKRTLYRRY